MGNIYFANYPKWLGRTQDLYFYRLIPEYFRGAGAQGELLCLDCAIEHLREAMPFDKVVVKMYLESVYECGANLYFEFYRLDRNDTETKIGLAKHKVAWVSRDEELRPVTTKFPPQILKDLEKVYPRSSLLLRG